MAVKAINDEGHFQAELSAAGGKLVVVDFTATWCGPCRNIAPLFEQLPTKYPKAVFLKVDVDKCAETAATQGVSAMPTFIFYRARVNSAGIRRCPMRLIRSCFAFLSFCRQRSTDYRVQILTG